MRHLLAICLAMTPALADEPIEAAWRIGSTDLRHDAGVTAVAVSPGGDLVVSGGSDGWIRIWSLADGRLVRAHGVDSRNPAMIRSVAFSPDGRFIAWGDWPSRVFLWEHAAGAPRRICIGNRAQVVAFTSDGRRLVCSGGLERGRDGTAIAVWDVQSGERALVIEADHTWRMAVSPDGKTLVTAGTQEKPLLRAWNLEDGSMRWSMRLEDVRTLSYTPDGASIVTGNFRRLEFRAPDSGESVSGLDLPRPARNAIVSPDGKDLALLCDEDIVLFDRSTGESRTLEGHVMDVESVAFSPDCGTLVSGARDGTVRVWDLRSLAEKFPQRFPSSPVVWLEALEDGRTLQTVSVGEGEVRSWNLPTLEAGPPLRMEGPEATWLDVAAGRVAGLRGDHGMTMTSMAMPDGELEQPIELVVWDVATGRTRMHTPFPVAWKRPGKSARLSQDDRFVTCGFMDGKIRVWRVDTGEMAAEFDRSEWGHAISSDGRTIAANSMDDKRLVLRDLSAPGAPVTHSWDATGGEDLCSPHFVLADRFLLAWDEGAVGRLWEVATRRSVLEFPTHRIYGFSPDRRFVVVGDEAGGLAIVDLATGRTECRLAVPGRPCSCTFTVDLRQLIGGLTNGTIVGWDLPELGGGVPQGGASFDELAGDAPAAYSACWRLAADPDAALSVLAEGLRAPDLDEERIEALLRGLDEGDFAAREAAQAELESLGLAAAGRLAHALEAADTPVEVKGRVQAVLEAWSPQVLQSRRAIFALRAMGERGRPLLERVAGEERWPEVVRGEAREALGVQSLRSR